MKRLGLGFLLFCLVGLAYGLGRWHGAAAANREGAARNAAAAPVAEVGLAKARAAEVARGSTAAPSGLDQTAPFSRNLSAAERGYEAARRDLDEALRQIEGLPASERTGFVTGIFAFVSRTHSPAEALKIQQRAPEAHRAQALRALVGEWIYTRSALDEERRHAMRESALGAGSGRLGVEVELSHMLASSQPDAELAGAWLEAFSKHGSRSEILISMAGGATSKEAETVLGLTENWTPWEKERVTRSVLANWAYRSPKEAWEWFEGNRGRFGQDLSAGVLAPWAATDPEAVKRLLGTMDDPARRKTAIEAIGKVLAERNTDGAVEWANSFANPGERAAANQAIYDGAPRGIGAVLGYESGFPTIRGVMPGGPLDGSGVQPGDRLIELREANGNNESLYAKDLQAAVNLIRGEAGSRVTLRVLREDKASGQFQEHEIPITRGQLYLNEKQITNRFAPIRAP